MTEIRRGLPRRERSQLVDRITTAQRSENMKRIRATNTLPEKLVRAVVCELGFKSRYRLHRRDLPGCPDIVFPSLRRVIFVHGCFWHAHSRCAVAHRPGSRIRYWGPKLARNRERDARNQRRLKNSGWRVLVVWECSIRNDIQSVRAKIQEFLDTAEN